MFSSAKCGSHGLSASLDSNYTSLMASAVGADRFWQIDPGCLKSELYERRAADKSAALFVCARGALSSRLSRRRHGGISGLRTRQSEQRNLERAAVEHDYQRSDRRPGVRLADSRNIWVVVAARMTKNGVLSAASCVIDLLPNFRARGDMIFPPRRAGAGARKRGRHVETEV